LYVNEKSLNQFSHDLSIVGCDIAIVSRLGPTFARGNREQHATSEVEEEKEQNYVRIHSRKGSRIDKKT
jgi:hypothetical protein